jgi:hypothetical protein
MEKIQDPAAERLEVLFESLDRTPLSEFVVVVVAAAAVPCVRQPQLPYDRLPVTLWHNLQKYQEAYLDLATPTFHLSYLML